MDKGIRPAAIAKFLELAPQRVAKTLTNTQFRKNVMASIMEDFGITLASAATHYNHAFISAKTSHPAFVEGLGRPEDKKGGRKPKAKPEAAVTPITAPNALLANMLKATGATGGAMITEAASQVGLEGLQSDADKDAEADAAAFEAGSDEAPQDDLALISDAINPPVQKFSVCKAGDKTVVCSDLTLDEANALIEKAAKAKKAKLELVA